MRIKYPTIDDIVLTNKDVLKEVKVRKADKHVVLSKEKIEALIKKTKNKKGNIYDKTVTLLKGILQEHPFASGNKRTAFVVMKNFLYYNNIKSFKLEHDPKILQGIRENFYTETEIKEWLLGGDIREFKR